MDRILFAAPNVGLHGQAGDCQARIPGKLGNLKVQTRQQLKYKFWLMEETFVFKTVDDIDVLSANKSDAGFQGQGLQRTSRLGTLPKRTYQRNFNKIPSLLQRFPVGPSVALLQSTWLLLL